MNHFAPVVRRISRSQTVPRHRALLVLGMHRSGTSALTRVLGLCGATLPSQDSSNIHPSNPLGHWEPRKIVQAHDRFLSAVGTTWDATVSYPDAIFDTEAAADCRRSLTSIARKEFGETPLFVLKDPRISRLMPLWRPVLSEIGAAPHAVIIVRNPLEIAGSLSSRDDWDEHRAVMVTIQHLLSAERATRDLPRCFVRYDDLMDDWRTVVERMGERLDIAFPVRGAATEDAVDAFVRGDLRHHRRPVAEFMGRNDIADCLKQAFRHLSDAAETGKVDYAALDAIAGDIADAEAIFKRVLRRNAGVTLHTISATAMLPAKRDALLALVMAEYGRADDVARRSKRLADQIMATRSWRFTRGFRVLGRAIARVLNRIASRCRTGETLPSR